jgi:hypothetical protein
MGTSKHMALPEQCPEKQARLADRSYVCAEFARALRDSPHYYNRYLLNPYIFLPCLALSTSTVETTLQLLTLMFASRGMRQALPYSSILMLSRPAISLSLDTRRSVASVFTRDPPTFTGSPAPPLGPSITSSITKAVPQKAL